MITKVRKYIPISKVASISILIIFIALLVVIYYPTFIWIWDRWFATDSYYSHGLLIPIVSVVLIWLKRKELTRTSVSSSRLGLIFLGMGLFLHIASAFTRVHFTSGFSLIFVLLGLILYLFGKAFTRVVLFPILFLFLMVPAPMQVIAMTTLKMKLFVAEISTHIVPLFGITTLREGSTVYMPTTSIVIADQCSGLRSLISLSALIILYVYLAKASYIRKTALVILSVPIAIIANVVRIIAVLFVANSYGAEVVTAGMLDKVFGFLVFVVALVGLVIAGKLLKCQFGVSDMSKTEKTRKRWCEAPEGFFLPREAYTRHTIQNRDNRQSSIINRQSKAHLLVAALPLLITAILTFGAYSVINYSGKLYTEDIPMIIGDWYGKDLPISERVYEILETRDTFTREYVSTNGERILFTVVFAQSNRKVAHPPEVCIRGAGWNISPMESETIALTGGKIDKVTMNKFLLKRGNEIEIVLYLYKAGDMYTTSYYRHQINVVLNSILRKNSSAALIEIIVPAHGDDLVKTTKVAKKFAKLTLPILSERLP